MFVFHVNEFENGCNNLYNRTACIIHKCTKTTILSCNSCLINTDVEKRMTFKYRLEL